MHRWIRWFTSAALLATAILPSAPLFAQSDLPPADIINDEGGPVLVTGVMNYTNPLTTMGVAQPLIILEDQAGFVARDKGFLFPKESQVLGMLTSDFFESPVSWSLSLPAVPQGTLSDVDNDGEEDTGVMVFAPAYWTNSFGDPYLEQRELGGGGWSTAFATTRIDPNPSADGEYVGGQVIVYAPEEGQGFPAGFGDDGLLFTADDPIVALPAGYTLVDLDSAPFTFDRSRELELELYEPEGFALNDYADMGYTEAFDALVELFRTKYAFTEYKGVDWDALSDEFRPQIQVAEAAGDFETYALAMRDFIWRIPDGHVSVNVRSIGFEEATAGGLGIAIRELDDQRVIVNYLTAGSPAEEAGIQLGAEILAMDGEPIGDFVGKQQPFSAPFSSEHNLRLQQLRYATRAPLDTVITVEYKNPGDSESTTVELVTADEFESFSYSSLFRGTTGLELPVEFEILDSGIGLVKIYSFSDNELLTAQLWERMITTMKDAGVTGLIIDMRQNGGGSGTLADNMAGYFFSEERPLGNTGFFDESLDEFYFNPETRDILYPPSPELQYDGDVAVLVGPSCASACEFFTYDLTYDDRAEVVGMYPTAGLGGSIDVFVMPEGIEGQYTRGRAVDPDGEIHIEGKGVAPTYDIPVNETTLFYDGDVILDAAEALLLGEELDLGAAPVAEEVVTEEEIVVTEEATPEATEATEEATPEATVEPTPEATEEATPEPTEEVIVPSGETITVATSGGPALLRNRPSYAGTVVGSVNDGDVLAVLERTDDGGWVRVEVASATNGFGWLNKRFIAE
jgi:C-terminal processing protease CtpA/Prc